MNATAHSSYDAVAYVSQPFSFTHPVRLAALGTLFGLETPRPESARILEIGCAAGTNLCGIASSLPGSTCIGVDLSREQIEQGKKTLAALGLNNVDLRHGDIAECGAELGELDYIICHGVFSWVSPELQQRILRLCREQLSPNGIAYVSYNTLPGWYPRRMIRDMLLYHAEPFRDSDMFLPQARAMVSLLQRSLRNTDAPLAAYLKNSLAQIESHPDWYLRHDVLEETNEPLYFSQFAAMLEKAGLQYLCDSELSKMTDFGFPEDVRKALRGLSDDILRYEQYLDFLFNRGFRRSLICHASAAVQRPDAWRRLEGLRLASSLHGEGRGEVTRFESETHGFIETNDPLLIHVLRALGEAWPQSRAFDELFRSAIRELGPALGISAEGEKSEREELARNLFQLAMRSMLELSLGELPFVTTVSNAPVASPLARFQSSSPPFEVTNVRQEVIVLDEREARLLATLDGSRAREAVESEESRGKELLERFAEAALLTG